MDNPNPIYYKDLVTPDDSITKLIEQLRELVAEYETAKGKIQQAASDVAKGLQGVSGATEEQRKAIQLATEQSDRLLASYRDVTAEAWKAKQDLLQEAAARKEATKVDKLVVQVNTSKEGSYNRLSAQYRLNKIRLNEMSKAEREGTEAGRQLEAETAAIYEEMKRLQEATGKHQLNVGNYSDAAKDLRAELSSLTQQMAYLKTQGQDGSEEYKTMATRAGELEDAMMDARREVKGMSSDTQALDATMGAASAVSGGMAAYTGLMALVGTNSETASDAQKSLGASISILAGVTAIQNALQKESNLMTGIRILQTKAATKATQLDTAAKGKNIAATIGATIAQKAFNLVAAANPYVLLAIALVTVVGALVAFAAGSSRAAKEQVKLNKAVAAQLDYMERLASSATRTHDERIKQLGDELEVAKARKAGLGEIRALEDEIYRERVKAHDKQLKIYAEQVQWLDANRYKLEQLYKTLMALQQLQASGKTRVKVDVDLDGRVERAKIDKAIDAIQGQIDNYERAVQVAVELKTEGEDIAKERAIQLAQRRSEAQTAAKTETDIVRAAEEARIALIRDSYTRERKALKQAAQSRIEDIRTRLKTENTLTKKAREALNDQIKSIQAKFYRDLEDLRNKYVAVDRAVTRETEDMRLALMEEGAEKQRTELGLQYRRRVEDLNTTLATERDLTETQVAQIYEQLLLLGEQYRKDLAKLNGEISIDTLQRESDALQLRLEAVREGSEEEIDLTLAMLAKQRAIELAENAALSEELRQSEADINAKWDAIGLKTEADLAKKRATMLLDAQQELEASEFALLDRNERQKTQFQLMQERERLRKLLELDKAAGGRMTEEQRKAMQNTIRAIEKEARKSPYNNIYEVMGIGLDSNQQDALNTAISSIKDSIASLVDSWNAAADAALNAANAQVDAAQRTLDAEIEARNAGYANEVATAQRELELARKTQDQATKDKEKAQKAQQALDSLTQASSLITASANIWSSLSGIPIVGPGLAAAALAAMWATFIAAKVKARQVTEQYGEGTLELLQGGSHASGNDIDLGVKPDGTRRRAEGGEFFAVINKRNSRRYRDVIPDVIKSLNDGSFADKYQMANATMAGYAVGFTDVSTLERDVAAIRRQGEEVRYTDAQGNVVIRYKNLTRRIKA